MTAAKLHAQLGLDLVHNQMKRKSDAWVYSPPLFFPVISLFCFFLLPSYCSRDRHWIVEEKDSQRETQALIWSSTTINHFYPTLLEHLQSQLIGPSVRIFGDITQVDSSSDSHSRSDVKKEENWSRDRAIGGMTTTSGNLSACYTIL